MEIFKVQVSPVFVTQALHDYKIKQVDLIIFQIKFHTHRWWKQITYILNISTVNINLSASGSRICMINERKCQLRKKKYMYKPYIIDYYLSEDKLYIKLMSSHLLP
jgi:hypothetical protein